MIPVFYSLPRYTCRKGEGQTGGGLRGPQGEKATVPSSIWRPGRRNPNTEHTFLICALLVKNLGLGRWSEAVWKPQTVFGFPKSRFTHRKVVFRVAAKSADFPGSKTKGNGSRTATPRLRVSFLLSSPFLPKLRFNSNIRKSVYWEN